MPRGGPRHGDRAVPPLNARRLLAIVALGALGAGLLGAVLGQADVQTARALLAEARWGWAAAAVAGFAANHALRLVRWHVLLASPIGWGRQTVVCLVGFMAISTLPLRLGELVRPALLVREGVPVGRTLAALVVERVFDLLALLGLLLWAATVPDLPALAVDGFDVVALGRRSAAAALLVLLGALGVGTAAAPWLRGWPGVGPVAQRMAEAAHELAAAPGRALAGAGLTAAIWAAIGVYVRGGLAVIPSLPQSWEAAAVTWAGVMATITALPTPGFFGAYEAGAAGALGLYGVPAATSGVWALGLHAAYVAFVGALGVPALAWTASSNPTPPTHARAAPSLHRGGMG